MFFKNEKVESLNDRERVIGNLLDDIKKMKEEFDSVEFMAYRKPYQLKGLLQAKKHYTVYDEYNTDSLSKDSDQLLEKIFQKFRHDAIEILERARQRERSSLNAILSQLTT